MSGTKYFSTHGSRDRWLVSSRIARWRPHVGRSIYSVTTKPRDIRQLASDSRNAAKSWRVSIMLLHWLARDFFLLFGVNVNFLP